MIFSDNTREPGAYHRVVVACCAVPEARIESIAPDNVVESGEGSVRFRFQNRRSVVRAVNALQGLDLPLEINYDYLPS